MKSLPDGNGHGFPPEEWIRHLQERGVAVSLTPEHIVASSALEELHAELKTWFAGNEEMSFSEFRELSGLARKLGIPMLEHLDRSGWTRRAGDVRVAGPRLSEDA